MYGRIITFKRGLIIISLLLVIVQTCAGQVGAIADSATNDPVIAVSIYAGPDIVLEGLREVGRNGVALGFEMGIRTGDWNFDVGVGFAGPNLNDDFLTAYGIKPDSFHIEGMLWRLQCGRRFSVGRRFGLVPMLSIGYMNVRESSYPDGMELENIPTVESSSYPAPSAALRLCRRTGPETNQKGFLKAGLMLFLEMRVTWYDFGDSPLNRGPALGLTFGVTGETRVSR